MLDASPERVFSTPDCGPMRPPSAPMAPTPTPGTRDVAAGPGPTCVPTAPECCN
ncbi:hypothetical protein L798_06584 [Zootermopsis nevadensis]|uniref:Uncharacterized protein n=1 Tax=Zootermopsis nevadensis TaxID=136037 RepID=A0A067REW8_ZOONE|nr:hypothetical protein L798_06584 [Zootermopsis nevadensis]